MLVAIMSSLADIPYKPQNHEANHLPSGEAYFDPTATFKHLSTEPCEAGRVRRACLKKSQANILFEIQ